MRTRSGRVLCDRVGRYWQFSSVGSGTINDVRVYWDMLTVRDGSRRVIM